MLDVARLEPSASTRLLGTLHSVPPDGSLDATAASGTGASLDGCGCSANAPLGRFLTLEPDLNIRCVRL